jgi:hypothetical protein
MPDESPQSAKPARAQTISDDFFAVFVAVPSDAVEHDGGNGVAVATPAENARWLIHSFARSLIGVRDNPALGCAGRFGFGPDRTHADDGQAVLRKLVHQPLHDVISGRERLARLLNDLGQGIPNVVTHGFAPVFGDALIIRRSVRAEYSCSFAVLAPRAPLAEAERVAVELWRRAVKLMSAHDAGGVLGPDDVWVQR